MSSRPDLHRGWACAAAALLLLLLGLAGCVPAGGCADGSCEGNDGKCYSCSGNTTCSTSGGSNCGAANHGTYCCTGGSTGSSCGCGTLCNSNGYCCARGTYGCNNRCYASYNEMLSAGCSSVKTCCP